MKRTGWRGLSRRNKSTGSPWAALKHNAGLLLFFLGIASVALTALAPKATHTLTDVQEGETAVKWVDFDVPISLLEKAMDLDISTWQEDVHLDWIQLLSLSAAECGGDFRQYQSGGLERFAEKLREGKTPEELTASSGLYQYYLQAYGAVLSGFLGEYEVEIDEKWHRSYGLKAFSPIANGFYYTDYDDFGNGRSYGFKRTHLGHDMMVSTGTPIIAVEGGTVEALGWNQYGGWRIGVRSFDQKRYYYYAHLRKDRPYAANMHIGQTVTAGDVIGYSGQTGYSLNENVNNIDTPHLHYGMQLIFDEEEKDSPNQIWIDLYAITKLLQNHRADVVQDYDTGEYERRYSFRDLDAPVTLAPDDHLGEAAGVISSAAASGGGFTAEGTGRGTEPGASAGGDGEGGSQQLALPIIMYHSLLKDSSRHSEFTISPDLFASDLAYLKERGYETVSMSQVIAHVKEGAALPEKPVVLTFDDGFYNNAYYALPLLEEYNFKAVFSLVGSLTDDFSTNGDSANPNYSYITWSEAKDLLDTGLIELQNHSYDMHGYSDYRRGALKRAGESQEEYRRFFTSDLLMMQERLEAETGWRPNTFTYPYGLMEDGTTAYLREMGFSASLSCVEGINYLAAKKPEDDAILFGMKRILRPENLNSADFFGKWGIK